MKTYKTRRNYTNNNTANTPKKPNWKELLNEAITNPGAISEAYFYFHNYSFGNQILALMECAARGIQPGPLAPFSKWTDRGRFVKKGEHAISLIMPVTYNKKVEKEAGSEDEESRTVFILKPRWFVLSQTEGAEFKPEPAGDFDPHRAAAALEITVETFTHIDGNTQGYANGRTVAVSPLADNPTKTMIHELAHVVLNHTDHSQHSDGAEIPRNIREVEAEGVAYIITKALDLPGAEFSRGYIQHWLKGNEIPEYSCRRIFSTAEKILKAGRPAQEARPQ